MGYGPLERGEDSPGGLFPQSWQNGHRCGECGGRLVVHHHVGPDEEGIAANEALAHLTREEYLHGLLRGGPVRRLETKNLGNFLCCAKDCGHESFERLTSLMEKFQRGENELAEDGLPAGMAGLMLSRQLAIAERKRKARKDAKE